jgi:hypothetical protein
MFLNEMDVQRITDRTALTLRCQNHDRPLMWISYPKKIIPGNGWNFKSAADWMNFEARIDYAEREMDNAVYLAEGFPNFWCNLGPDVLAAFTGSELEFSETTSWAKFRVKDWNTEPPVILMRNSPIWQAIEKFTRLSVERGRGRWITGTGDIHTNADLLAALRGPQELLTDLIDCPEEIKKRLRESFDVFREVMDEQFNLTLAADRGLSSGWIQLLCPGRYTVTQNDFSCMVGPEMFNDFFKEYVEQEAALFDFCVYHLDGPGAIKHTDAVCDAPHINAIQWVTGAGQKDQAYWPDLLKHIQSRGKGLWLNPSNFRDTETLMRMLKPEGCMYTLWCGSQEEARAYIKLAETVYRTRIV